MINLSIILQAKYNPNPRRKKNNSTPHPIKRKKKCTNPRPPYQHSLPFLKTYCPLKKTVRDAKYLMLPSNQSSLPRKNKKNRFSLISRPLITRNCSSNRSSICCRTTIRQKIFNYSKLIRKWNKK